MNKVDIYEGMYVDSPWGVGRVIEIFDENCAEKESVLVRYSDGNSHWIDPWLLSAIEPE